MTNAIVNGVNSKREPWGFLRELRDKLETYYNYKSVNFEDLIHCIETLLNYTKLEKMNELHYKHQPVLGSFIKFNDTRFINHSNLYKSKVEIMETIFNEVTKYNNRFDITGKHKFYADFWKDLCNKLSFDIYNLNYDMTIQNSLIDSDINFQDGFIQEEKEIFKRFDPKFFYSSSSNKVLSLHGNVNLGFEELTSKDKRRSLDDSFQDLYLYPSSREAKKSWGREIGRSDINTQTGEKIISYPLISGMRKLEKLNVVPFSYYHSMLPRSIAVNNALLVVGYSFNDQHINSILNKHKYIHGQNRRVCLITFMNDTDKENWHHSIGEMGMLTELINESMFSFIARSSNEVNPQTTFEFKNPHKSMDENFRIYFGGFKDTINNYKKDILEFLNS